MIGLENVIEIVMSEDNQDPLKSDGDAGSLVIDQVKLKRPKLYKVLLHNDDYTTMEFVIFILQKVFQLHYDKAYQVMLKVHQEGVGICGVYTFEIAESKCAKVVLLAKDNGHPLRCSFEEE